MLSNFMDQIEEVQFSDSAQLGAVSAFKKNSRSDGRVSFTPNSIKFPILLHYVFATVRESVLPDEDYEQLIGNELIICTV